jgi:hypothetical protein
MKLSCQLAMQLSSIASCAGCAFKRDLWRLCAEQFVLPRVTPRLASMGRIAALRLQVPGPSAEFLDEGDTVVSS